MSKQEVEYITEHTQDIREFGKWLKDAVSQIRETIDQAIDEIESGQVHGGLARLRGLRDGLRE